MFDPLQSRRELLSSEERDGSWREWANYVLIKIQENGDSVKDLSDKTSSAINRVVEQIREMSDKKTSDIEKLKKEEIDPIKKDVQDIKLTIAKYSALTVGIMQTLMYLGKFLFEYLKSKGN